jgi:hypothetical protein
MAASFRESRPERVSYAAFPAPAGPFKTAFKIETVTTNRKSRRNRAMVRRNKKKSDLVFLNLPRSLLLNGRALSFEAVQHRG